MASLRDIRRRIKSRQNMQKITKALQVVSATKLRRAQQAVERTRPYAAKMLEVLQTTTETASEYRHPFLDRREGDNRLYIVITSDRGLAGGLNSNVMRAVNRHLRENAAGDPRFVTIGRKGRDLLLRMGRNVVAEVSGLPDRAPPIGEVLPAVHAALDEYRQGNVDQIYLAYSRFASIMRQEPTVRRLVTVELPERDAAEGNEHRLSGDYIYEPDPESVLDGLLPRYVETQVYQALLENQASEHAARMVAMQSATNAAGDLIKSLTLTANKVRQATITAELMDIVGGAEALRASTA